MHTLCANLSAKNIPKYEALLGSSPHQDHGTGYFDFPTVVGGSARAAVWVEGLSKALAVSQVI